MDRVNCSIITTCFYGFLFSYLRLVLEGRNPLVSYLRACQQNHEILSNAKPVSIGHLQKAWNAFARLLNTNWNESFQCPLCGPSPPTIVCHGTMIGFRKDFLPQLSHSTLSTPQIVGSRLTRRERVLVSSTTKARSLLMKYAGYKNNGKCVWQHKKLTRFKSFALPQVAIYQQAVPCIGSESNYCQNGKYLSQIIAKNAVVSTKWLHNSCNGSKRPFIHYTLM